jgi:hypothetical protein
MLAVEAATLQILLTTTLAALPEEFILAVLAPPVLHIAGAVPGARAVPITVPPEGMGAQDQARRLVAPEGWGVAAVPVALVRLQRITPYR